MATRFYKSKLGKPLTSLQTGITNVPIPTVTKQVPKSGSGKPATKKSTKTGVPANRDSNTNKTGKVTRKTPKNNTRKTTQSAKSNRISYKSLLSEERREGEH